MIDQQPHTGSVHQYLANDHVRLGSLLDHAIGQTDVIDTESYEAFRAGLLRHIGLEEKLLFPPSRHLGAPSVDAMVSRLHREHAVFAAMLVPMPTREILVQLRGLLGDHNTREEGPEGIYEISERIAGPNTEALAAQLRAGPEARTAKHYDTDLSHENIRVLLEALKES